MTEDTNTTPTDKSTWGSGPWETEPDRAEWTHAGLPCLARRSGMGGNWCGYAAVPPGHPLHGTSYHDAAVEVHGGLTYAGACSGAICHVPTPGEPDDVWWFGFDCAHFGDFMPAMDARLRRYRPGERPAYDHAATLAAEAHWRDVYRTLAYVQAETNQLADQLAALAHPASTDAVDPSVADPGTPTTRDKNSSSLSFEITDVERTIEETERRR